MKKFAVIMSVLVASFAQADSSIECKLKTGAKPIMGHAPDKIEIDEAGEVWLVVNGNSKASVKVGKNAPIYDSTKDITFKFPATLTLLVGPKTGLETIAIKGCANGATQATYSFSYREADLMKGAGSAFYDCKCEID